MTPKQKAAARRALAGKATADDRATLEQTDPPSDDPPELTPEQITGKEPLPENAGKTAVSIDIKTPYHKMAGYIADAIPMGMLYLHNGSPMTIEWDCELKAMTWRDMTPERFATWLQQKHLCNFYSQKGKGEKATRQETDFSAAQAKIILSSDDFRNALPVCREIVNVRLPVLKKEDKGHYTFAPAPVGYDPEAEIYTIDSHPIDWSKGYTTESCVSTFCRWFKEFPLDGGMSAADLATKSPSMGACVTAMLGQFLHNAIDTFPLVLINANQEGTGKTFLAKCLLAPILGGQVDVNNYIEDEGEMRKTLNSMLFDGSPYCLLDDIRRLVNNTLNRFITSKTIKDRELGTNKTFKKPNRMQFFVTGNRVKTSADVERRTMPIDLFTEENSRGRTFRGILNEASITTEEYIGTMLTICWSLTLNWMRAGCPRYLDNSKFKSFDLYRDIPANIAMHAGFADPLGERVVYMDAGDTMASALTDLVTAIADAIEPDTQFLGNQWVETSTGKTLRLTTEQILTVAEALFLKDEITGAAKNPLISLGGQLAGIRGRKQTDSHGRTFQVGRKETRARSMHVWHIMSERNAAKAKYTPGTTDLLPEREENVQLARAALLQLGVLSTQ